MYPFEIPAFQMDKEFTLSPQFTDLDGCLFFDLIPLVIKSHMSKCMGLVKFKTAQIMYKVRNTLPSKNNQEMLTEREEGYT